MPKFEYIRNNIFLEKFKNKGLLEYIIVDTLNVRQRILFLLDRENTL